MPTTGLDGCLLPSANEVVLGLPPLIMLCLFAYYNCSFYVENGLTVGIANSS